MRIIIVGAGRTGTQLALRLVQEKHDISMIEADEEKARHASNRLDCLVVHDDGNSLAALEDAGIAKAGALVCVTDSDEVNMIICGLAASLYPNLFKMARVRNDDYIQFHKHSNDSKIMGIDYFIHPDVEASRAILRSISHGAIGNVFDFAGTSYGLRSIDVAKGSAFEGLSLKNYRSIVKEDSLAVLIERNTGNSEEFIIPSGSSFFMKGDRIHILASEQHMENIFLLAGRHEKPIKHIGIVGGGRIGMLVAERILGQISSRKSTGNSKSIEHEEKKKPGILSFFRFISRSSRRVVIVEQSYEICKELSARFPEALILNADISDERFVAEEHLGDLDLVVTATPNQELNIITAVYLKSRGVKRAIALVSGPGYETIARQLGVDVVIPMQSVEVESILSGLMNKGIREVHILGGGNIEIMEAEIGLDSPAVDKSIGEFSLAERALILLVKRGDFSFIPKGDYIFRSDDKVILIAKNGSEAELEKFFGIPK